MPAADHSANQTKKNFITHNNESLPLLPAPAHHPRSSSSAAAATQASGATAAATATPAYPPASLSRSISYTSFPAYGTFQDPNAPSLKFRFFFRFLDQRRKPGAKKLLDLESRGAEPLPDLKPQSELELELEPQSGSESESKLEGEKPRRWELKDKLGTVVMMMITEGIATVFFIGMDDWIPRLCVFLTFVIYICFSDRLIDWDGWMPRIRIR